MKPKRNKVYAKDGWLYVAVRIPDEKRPGKTRLKRIATGLEVGREAEAAKLREYMQERQNAQKESGFEDGNVTVAAFALKKFIPGRKHQSTWKDDEQRLEDFVLPVIGDMPIADTRSRHLLELFKALTAATKIPTVVGKEKAPRLIAPRTVLNIYAVTRSMFREAKVLDLIGHEPCDIPSKYLPPRRDKDLGWRSTALFSRREMRMIVWDERLSVADRVMYGTFFLGSLRIGEIAALRFRHLSFARNPLGKLLVAEAVKKDGSIGLPKTAIAREMPMHPTLRKLLLRWKKAGWVEVMGRAPTPDDFVFPVMPRTQTNFGRGKRRPVGGHQTASVIYKAWVGNLDTLGLRKRRDHDLRRTLITMAQEDGADESVLERCTHTPGNQKAIQLYNSISWKRKCEHVGRLRFKFPKTDRPSASAPQLVAVGAEGQSPEAFHSDFTQPTETDENQLDTNWRRRESNPTRACLDDVSGAPSVAPSARKFKLLSVDDAPADARSRTSEPGASERVKSLRADLLDVQEWLQTQAYVKRVQVSRVKLAGRLREVSGRLGSHPDAQTAIDLALEALAVNDKSGREGFVRIVAFLIGSALRRVGSLSRHDGQSKSKQLRQVLGDGEWHAGHELSKVVGPGRQLTDALRRIRDGLDGEPPWALETAGQQGGRQRRFRRKT